MPGKTIQENWSRHLTRAIPPGAPIEIVEAAEFAFYAGSFRMFERITNLLSAARSKEDIAKGIDEVHKELLDYFQTPESFEA